MLLIARAPVRISFGGGGTDLPAYYMQFGGAVLSTAINRYIYTFISRGASDALQIISSDFRVFYRHTPGAPFVPEGELGLAKAVLREFPDVDGLDVFIASQIPPGTGLGGSGAVAVSMITALSAWHGRNMSKQDIAEMACDIGINKLRLPSGKQDEYGAAMGGLNLIEFTKDGTTVNPVQTPPGTLETLQQRLMLFYTGKSRDSVKILTSQSNASRQQDPSTLERMHRIKALGADMLEVLQRGQLDEFADLLHQSWLQKRGVTSDITNNQIDLAYETARKQGALAGKITGAGGGGFLMIYCHVDHQPAVTAALQAQGLARMDFRFDFDGASVLLNQGELVGR
ncbi:MAG: GHMP kinase [Anaerolineae bacterium]|nr:GHMP kinase [Anaerolineae bacterium]